MGQNNCSTNANIKWMESIAKVNNVRTKFIVNPSHLPIVFPLYLSSVFTLTWFIFFLQLFWIWNITFSNNFFFFFPDRIDVAIDFSLHFTKHYLLKIFPFLLWLGATRSFTLSEPSNKHTGQVPGTSIHFIWQLHIALTGLWHLMLPSE